MKENIRQFANSALDSPTSAVSVSAGTTATGLSTWLEILPPLLGILASFAGGVLTIVLVYNHIKRGALERDVLELDKKIKVQELERLR